MTGAGRWVGGPVDGAAQASMRLFCFAHAGGGPAFFRPWRYTLAPRVDVRPVLLPGREARIREPACRRMEGLVDALCAGIAGHLDRPYALFGHSMGSAVAYEVARRFSARGRPPAVLIVSGRRAPRLEATRPTLSGLPDEAFVAAIGKLNGTPAEVLDQRHLLRVLLPALRSDFELHERYRRLPGDDTLGCPVAAYMGESDPEVSPPELLRWRDETVGPFTLRIFPGDHFYLKDGRPDVVDAVARDLPAGVPEPSRDGSGVR